jgi:hypothetical protein
MIDIIPGVLAEAQRGRTVTIYAKPVTSNHKNDGLVYIKITAWFTDRAAQGD